jgi:predicted P-loop ATPase
VRTGSGGLHLYFRRPEGAKWGNTSRRVEHIDTRCDGGYVIAPPSIHPDTGLAYEFSSDDDPAPFPQKLVDAFYPPKKTPAPAPAPTLPSTSASALVNIYTRAVPPTYATRALEEECKKVANAGEGTRNHTLNGAAFSLGQIVGAGLLSEGDAERELWNAAMAAGLEEGETQKTIASGLRDGKQQPRQVKDRAPRKRAEPAPAPSSTSTTTAREPDDVVAGPSTAVVVRGASKLPEAVRKECRHAFGRIVGSAANLRHILLGVDDVKGLFAFNEFSHRVELTRAPPWQERSGIKYPRPAVDVDYTRLRVWLEDVVEVSFPKDDVGALVWSLADLQAFHPVRDYLEGLTWDRTPRLDTWLVRHGGADDTAYVRAASAAWAISAVARAYRPGCKVDSMPVLEGEQGIGKSTLLRTLVGSEWFLDHLPEIGSKDAAIILGKAWVHEFSELSALTRADVEPIKQFLTQANDVYRPPYGRDTVEVSRSCVFIATTNRNDYLRDSTGNRRFNPVELKRADVAGVAAERDQLWAEAVARFKAGEPWHFTHADVRAEAQRQQADRLLPEAWAPEIEKHLAAKAGVPGWTTTSDIINHLGLELAKVDNRALGRIREALIAAGWAETRTRAADGTRQRRWGPKVDQSGPKGGPEGGPEGSSSRTEGTGANPQNIFRGQHEPSAADDGFGSLWGDNLSSVSSGPFGPPEKSASGSGEKWTEGLRDRSGPVDGAPVQRVAE